MAISLCLWLMQEVSNPWREAIEVPSTSPTERSV